jgi:hypothetical protein
MASVSSSAMMLITTSSSISVKPAPRFAFIREALDRIGYQ